MNALFLAAQSSAGGGGMSMLIMLVLMFVIMWFFMIRPQQKKQKEIQKFQNALERGSKVVVGGGIYGTVSKVDLAKGIVDVEIANGVTIHVDKAYVFKDPTDGQQAQAK